MGESGYSLALWNRLLWLFRYQMILMQLWFILSWLLSPFRLLRCHFTQVFWRWGDDGYLSWSASVILGSSLALCSVQAAAHSDVPSWCSQMRCGPNWCAPWCQSNKFLPCYDLWRSESLLRGLSGSVWSLSCQHRQRFYDFGILV